MSLWFECTYIYGPSGDLPRFKSVSVHIFMDSAMLCHCLNLLICVYLRTKRWSAIGWICQCAYITDTAVICFCLNLLLCVYIWTQRWPAIVWICQCAYVYAPSGELPLFGSVNVHGPSSVLPLFESIIVHLFMDPVLICHGLNLSVCIYLWTQRWSDTIESLFANQSTTLTWKLCSHQFAPMSNTTILYN